MRAAKNLRLPDGYATSVFRRDGPALFLYYARGGEAARSRARLRARACHTHAAAGRALRTGGAAAAWLLVEQGAHGTVGGTRAAAARRCVARARPPLPRRARRRPR